MERTVTEAYEYDAHKWVKCAMVGRERCVKCGLLALRNTFTQWCIRVGCDNTSHPRYKYERGRCGTPVHF